jgi:hypothetical protein
MILYPSCWKREVLPRVELCLCLYSCTRPLPTFVQLCTAQHSTAQRTRESPVAPVAPSR